MARLGTTKAWTMMIAAASVQAACQGSDGAPGAGGSDARGSSTHADDASSSHGHASVTAGAGGAFDCDPAAEAGSLFATAGVSFETLADTSMCKWRGDVLLVVNTAAQ